jgi:hypothetical protein
MRLRTAILVLAVTPGWAPALAQAPLDAEQDRILADARHTALNYTTRLPDFICNEVVRRFEAYGTESSWRNLGTLTLQLTFFEHHETYRLIALNGHSTTQNYDSIDGARSYGEFGSILLLLFHPDTKAAFQWRQWSSIRGRRVAVYSFQVAGTDSHFELSAGTNRVIVPYHGLISIEPESGRVLRIEDEAEPPDKFLIQQSYTALDYDFIDVGGQQYLLPARTEVRMLEVAPPPKLRRGELPPLKPRTDLQLRHRNVTEFRDYRKYTADSTLKFDGKLF